MEGSTSFSRSKALCSHGGAASSSEESGWTEYFDYFMASEKGKTASYHSSCAGSEASDGFSLVSDAASCVLAWNASPAGKVEIPKRCTKLKRRGRLDDDSLEDTASSPVSSPKVSSLNKFDMKPRKKDEGRNIPYQEKGVARGNRFDMKGQEMDEMDLLRRANECVELTEKGLCLVPLSMLVDYLG